MVCRRRRSRNPDGVAFVESPWSEQTPEFQALDQRLSEDHLARAIVRAVAELDLSDFLTSYVGAGSPPYRPEMLLRVVLYEMHLGKRSPAEWTRDARESEPVRWLLRGCEPSRARWYAFRDRVGPWLLDWNRQVLAQALDKELTPAERAALDGTLIAANASRHHLLNEARLLQREAQLAEAIAADQGLPTVPPASTADVLASPAASDPVAATEILVPPPDAAAPVAPSVAVATEATTPVSAAVPQAASAKMPGWMAKTPAGRQQQESRYQKARARMEQRQQRNQQKRASKRQKRDKIVVSASDSEAALGRDKLGVYRPLFNVQLLCDLDSPFILAYQVFAQPNDNNTLGPMLERQTDLVGHKVSQWLADAGYPSGEHLALAETAGVLLFAPWQENDYSVRNAKKGKKKVYYAKKEFRWLPEDQAYVCPNGQRLKLEGTSKQKRSGTETVLLDQYRCPPQACQNCPLHARCTPNPAAGRTISRAEHEELIEALRARMQTDEAKNLYRLRRQTVELSYADLKEHRKLRRFSGHGLSRAENEVGLEVLVHNLLTLVDTGQPRVSPRPAAPAPGKISA
jgi:transposase